MKCVWMFFLGTSSFVPEMLRPMCFSLNAQGACTFDLFKTHHPMSLKLILLINIISSGHGHSSRIICMYIYIYINIMFIRSSLRFSQLTETGTYHWTYIYIYMIYTYDVLSCFILTMCWPRSHCTHAVAPSIPLWPGPPPGHGSNPGALADVTHGIHILIICITYTTYTYGQLRYYIYMCTCMHSMHIYIYIRVNIYSDLMPWPHWTHGECIGFNIANIVLFQVRDML